MMEIYSLFQYSLKWVTFCSNNISNRVNQSTGEITDDTYWDELVVVVEVTDTMEM